MIRLHHVLTALASMTVSTVASAEPPEPSALFGVRAEPDAALAAVRGTANPFTSLTRGNLADAATMQSRGDFRLMGSVSRIQMDVWWGTTGSQMIATAVRTGG